MSSYTHPAQMIYKHTNIDLVHNLHVMACLFADIRFIDALSIYNLDDRRILLRYRINGTFDYRSKFKYGLLCISLGPESPDTTSISFEELHKYRDNPTISILRVLGKNSPHALVQEFDNDNTVINTRMWKIEMEIRGYEMMRDRLCSQKPLPGPIQLRNEQIGLLLKYMCFFGDAELMSLLIRDFPLSIFSTKIVGLSFTQFCLTMGEYELISMLKRALEVTRVCQLTHSRQLPMQREKGE